MCIHFYGPIIKCEFQHLNIINEAQNVSYFIWEFYKGKYNVLYSADWCQQRPPPKESVAWLPSNSMSFVDDRIVSPTKVQCGGSQSVVPGPGAPASPGSLLEKADSPTPPRSSWARRSVCGAQQAALKLSTWCWCVFLLRNYQSPYWDRAGLTHSLLFLLPSFLPSLVHKYFSFLVLHKFIPFKI